MIKINVILVLLSFQVISGQDRIDILSAGSQKEDKVLATVGKTTITVKEFLYGYEFGPSFPRRTDKSKETYLNYLINEKLISSEASDNKSDTSSEFLDNYKAIEADLASEELFKDKILPRVTLPSAELNASYNHRNTNVQLTWLFASTPESLISIAKAFKSGISFDSLYSLQFRDSILQDERSLSTDLFRLGIKSPEIVRAIDTLSIDEHSGPVKGLDGWYIFKVNNKWKDINVSDVKVSEIKDEVKKSLQKLKSDSLSSIFVDSLIRASDPVIKGDAFVLLRAYLGSYLLNEEQVRQWKLKERGDSAIAKLNPPDKNLNKIILVDYKNGAYTIDDFIEWYRIRSNYYKIDNRNYNSFSASVEKLIWRMVRDNLLTSISLHEGYQNKKEVKDQLRWWKDKLLFALEKEKMVQSIMLVNPEINGDSLNFYVGMELNKKILRKVSTLKRKYDIKIDKDLLKRIKVDDENNPNSIDIYAVKKEGIFPRPAYPTIDFLWESWQ